MIERRHPGSAEPFQRSYPSLFDRWEGSNSAKHRSGSQAWPSAPSPIPLHSKVSTTSPGAHQPVRKQPVHEPHTAVESGRTAHRAIEKGLKETPQSLQTLFRSVYSLGQTRNQAIKAMCVECMGVDKVAVKECGSRLCPLWKFRPYQAKGNRKTSRGWCRVVLK